jgi:chromosome partitioning protein
VDLIEGGRQLARVSTELAQRPVALTRLRDTLRGFTTQYDHIIIDSPPELGVITQNVLIASDAVIIPVQCMSIALLGMYDLLQTIEEVREHENPDLFTLGFVPTMLHGRTNHASQVVEHLNTEYEGQTSPPINHSIVFAESMGYATPIYQYAPDSKGAQDYRTVSEWFSQRI